MFIRIAQRYQGSTIVVIGAGGIGGALIQLVIDAAAKVFVADRDESLLKAIRESSEPGKVVTHTLDVRNESSVSEFFHDVQKQAGSPDYLFYTAGVLNIESFADTSGDTWRRAVEINLNGAFYCVKAASDLMKSRQTGSILLLSSIAGIRARSGSRVNPVYNATKSALSAFVNGTAMQLRSHGVRINCISPGPTQTSMMDLQPAAVHAAVNEIMLDHRMNAATEVAELALFVAAHGRLTGEDVALGGGAGLGG